MVALAERPTRMGVHLDSHPVPVYLSACFERQREMRYKRKELEQLGYVVTGSWIDEGEGEKRSSIIAMRDWHDVASARVFVLFTEPLVCKSGGKHVEMGIAYQLGQEIVLVGPRGNVFHHLEGVRQFDTWEDAKVYLEERRRRVYHG